MSPGVTFTLGILILALFGWYFATDFDLRKRVLGMVLTLVLVGLSLEALYPPRDKINLGLDLQGGTSFLLRLDPAEGVEISPDAIDQAVEVIRARIDEFGTGEPIIAPQGDNRILAQIPGLEPDTIAQAREQLERVAQLTFHLVHPETPNLLPRIERGEEIIPPGFVIKEVKEEVDGESVVRETILIRDRADLEGDRVRRARAGYGLQGFEVNLEFDGPGGRQFFELTRENVGNRFAIVLDGDVVSAPVIRGPIPGGRAQITGRFTEQEARGLASVLENPLRNPVEIEEQRSVSATLGADSIRMGITAGVSGLLITLVFIAVYYRFSGLVALVGLTVNIVLLFGAMSMFNFVLTLPGIAGIILVIGIAIDANVLIYERLREELEAGKSLRNAVDAAYDKAFSAIFDANFTTLITAAILFWLATGTVQGFAITLILGILASMFSALLVTRNCFRWALSLNMLKKLSMMNLIPQRHINFLGYRKAAGLISVIAIVASIGVFALRGENNFGIDFTGGDLLTIRAETDLTEADLRSALAEIDLADAVIQIEQPLGMDHETISIRSPFDTSDQVFAHLATSFPDAGISEEMSDKVGAVVGREMTRNSLIAIAVGLLGITIYLTLRFELSFAIGALAALVHDIIIVIGVFSLFGRELSLIMVGAILTIAGYSINDTIVVFDRIREGLKSAIRGSIPSIMNDSINRILGRTIITSGTTFFVVLFLYLFGGAVLNDFALAILTGIIVGTYSSIFVAAPVVLWWSGKGGERLRSEIRESEREAAALRAQAREQGQEKEI